MKSNICNIFLEKRRFVVLIMSFIYFLCALITIFFYSFNLKQLFWTLVLLLSSINLVCNGSYLFLKKVEYNGNEFDAYIRIIAIVPIYFSSIYFLFSWD